MKQYDYKTISRTMLGDLHTPVSTYLKVRDIFPQSALMESSDYHGSENNRSFIALCPLASVSIDHGTAIFRLPDDSREEHPITDAYRVENALNDFRARFRVEGEYSNYCGLYGYTSFNAVRYFENIPVKDSREATNDAPDMLYILYKYLIVFNDFKNEMLLLEMLAPGETKRVTIPFDGYTFRYFNVRTNRFEVEGGEYELLIGASCRDIRLTAKHTEQGTNAPNPYAQLAVQSYRTARVTDVSDAEFAALLGHAIPPHLWDKTQPLTLNDTVTQLSYAKNPLARLIYRILTRMKNKATAAGKPDLNLLFIYNIPFRGMAKMMNGMVSMAMAEDMLLMVNGHFFRGCGRLIHHFCHRPKLNLNPDKKKK